MYKLLIKLMLLTTLLQLGISVSDFVGCRSNVCLARLESKSRKVLDVKWKPISVFQEEAKRFR